MKFADGKIDFFIFYGKILNICLKWLKMCKTYQGKSHFYHFEAFLELYEKISENKIYSKTYLAILLFFDKFSKTIKNASK